jgi:hypothetical protein
VTIVVDSICEERSYDAAGERNQRNSQPNVAIFAAAFLVSVYQEVSSAMRSLAFPFSLLHAVVILALL